MKTDRKQVLSNYPTGDLVKAKEVNVKLIQCRYSINLTKVEVETLTSIVSTINEILEERD